MLRKFVCAAFAAALVVPTAVAQSGIQYAIVSNGQSVVGQIETDGVSVTLSGISSSSVVFSSPTLATAIAPSGSSTLLPVIGFHGSDIAACQNTVYLLSSTGPDAVNKYINRVTASGSTVLPGAATRVACANGVPWVVNNANNIFRWTGSAWQQLPGAASDIAGNASGVVWAIGVDGIPFKWDNATNNWVQGSSGAGISIAVDPLGNPWVINQQGQIFSSTTGANGLQWKQLSGAGSDIGISDSGLVSVVGAGGQIFQMQGPEPAVNEQATTQTIQTNGGSVSVSGVSFSVAPSYTASNVNTSSWTPLPYTVKAMRVAGTGSAFVFVYGAANPLHRNH